MNYRGLCLIFLTFTRSVDVHCLEEVLIRLTSGNTIQRKNALDVISELVCIFSHSINANSHLAWYVAILLACTIYNSLMFLQFWFLET